MIKEDFMREAIMLSRSSVAGGGGPFGAVIVKDGEIIARGANSVALVNDPTAHAEVCAIRAACSETGNFKLTGCDLYTSCEPCPMCLGAAYWAGINKIYYASTREDAADAGFNDAFIYDEIELSPDERSIPSENLLRGEAYGTFEMWNAETDRVKY